MHNLPVKDDTLPDLHHKTTVSDLAPGDVFAAHRHARRDDRLSPVVSVEDVGGQVSAHGDSVYPEGMHRVRHEDSDALGTLIYGDEVMFRASRT